MKEKERTADRGDPGKAAPAERERARARAYLDLWERHLVRLALEGPDPDPAPPRRRA